MPKVPAGKSIMPIRFRCAYCSQLMGIARRKAGTVVSCPTCHGQVVVPMPEPPIPPGTSPTNVLEPSVFERKDFDPALFNPIPGPSPASPISPPSFKTPPTDEYDVQPVALPSLPGAAGLPQAIGVKPSGRIVVLLLLGGLILAAIAFGAGFAVARLM
jgi:hypothetical protein